MQLFVKAHLLSESSVEINNSVLWTQNISETFQGLKGNLHSIADFFSDSSIVLVSYEDNPEIGTLVMFFDENWNLISYPTDNGALENAKYELLLCISELPAAKVYADTSADTSLMEGVALVGEIVILKMSDGTIIDHIPEYNNPGVISDRYTDYYAGIAEGDANET